MTRTGPTLLAIVAAVWGATCPAADAPQQTGCGTPAHAQFDFWLGDWEVFRPNGKLAGRNRIEKILDGCVVYENWTSAEGGYAGKSFNTYDPRSDRWYQVWVDNQGDTIHFSGSRRGNVMEMEGTDVDEKGTVYYRMSWTHNPDGTVRQVWEVSRDQATWEKVFDGLYRK